MTTHTVITQELTPAEIASVRRYLLETRDAAISATERLSEAQWNYRPPSGAWSTAGTVEHMILVQERILGPFAEALANSDETASEAWETIDAIVWREFPDRSRKFSAPEALHPTGRWNRAEVLDRLSANTSRLIERLELAPGLRRHRIPSPPLTAMTNGEHKLMDGFQWILAAATHTERHTRQILELQAEPGFPAN